MESIMLRLTAITNFKWEQTYMRCLHQFSQMLAANNVTGTFHMSVMPFFDLCIVFKSVRLMGTTGVHHPHPGLAQKTQPKKPNPKNPKKNNLKNRA